MTCYCGGCGSCLKAQGYDVRSLPNGRTIVIETEEDQEAYDRAFDDYIDAEIERTICGEDDK